MSNLEASKIYEQIIDEVISESRQDFEDSGIDEATLQDLRAIWRENLAETKVASFSWAPQLSDPLQTLDVKSEVGDISIPSNAASANGSSANFQLEVDDSNGEIAAALLKQKHDKKEKALASLDSDAINSDLDDSDEDDQESDEDGDDAEGNIILCLYEKVLRVKNKWKCNLKDGVANINGRDYAFAKATGESEW